MKACGDQLLWMCARSRGVKIEYRKARGLRSRRLEEAEGLSCDIIHKHKPLDLGEERNEHTY